MKYGDLVNFQRLDPIKELKTAEALSRARDDVRTYVISPRMAERFRDVIIPKLRLDRPADRPSMLIVATYGTGKTHLMSVVAGVAEYKELAADLRDPAVAKDAEAIAGRYNVIREEIGSTEMSLRGVICSQLEAGLARMGVTFKFPAADTVTNTKDALVEMMAAFEAKYPDQGLLYLLDELLDFLAQRKDQELREDLAILREIGEVTARTKFRFIAGVQEAIYDNPRFAPFGDAVIRVRDRFEQIPIVREDVAFVVKERLLRKTIDQKAWIRAHLTKFAPAFEGMSEHMDEFVDLFPVHPAYLRTFELMTLVEKRRVLITISFGIERLLDTQVPDDRPGLLTYDAYRAVLEEDHSFRTNEAVRIVLDRASVLRSRVERTIAQKADLPLALRLIDALAVQRLTTGDIEAPIGPTPAELRDDLCIYEPGRPLDPLFIATSIQTVIDEIVRAVDGLFITINPNNGQVFLDVKKDVDYDKNIEKRASSLDKTKLDEAYFLALGNLMAVSDTPYVTGYRIWSYQLPWQAHRVTRRGYLFFGTPGERDTAHPPLDFYLYFIQPYDPPPFKNLQKPDEVFFRLDSPDEEFTNALKRYAGATALQYDTALPAHRTVYRDKASQALAEMVAWLRKNMGSAVSVTYEGEARTVAERLALVSGPRGNVQEMVNTISSALLDKRFEERYPGYPTFSLDVSVGRDGNLAETVKQAIAQIVTKRPTVPGTKVLSALGLLDPLTSDLLDTGTYAAYLLSELAKSKGRALNRAELLVERDRDVWTWGPWHLEPVWLTVVAAAVCQLGGLETGFPTGQIDALGLERLTRMSLDELEQISHIAPPKATPVAMIRDAARLLGIPAGDIPQSGISEAVVNKILPEAAAVSQRISAAMDKIATGVDVWGTDAIDQKPERSARIQAFQKVVDDLRARNSVGKLNKLALTPEVLAAAEIGRRELLWVEATAEAKAQEQLTHRQVSAANAIKRDLVISSYKPTARVTEQIRLSAGSEEGVWSFVRERLEHLPVTEISVGGTTTIRERQADLLFLRTMAFHVANETSMPMAKAEFIAGLERRFLPRDGMYFLPEQAAQYERQMLTAGESRQQTLYITDESSAIEWIRQRLTERRLQYFEIHPAYFTETQSGPAAWEEIPTLMTLLDENFVQDATDRWMVPDVKDAVHLEQIRKRALLREFAGYGTGRGRLDRFRSEAVLAGFQDAWSRRDFKTIVKIGRRLPEDAFADEPTIHDFYRNAERLADA